MAQFRYRLQTLLDQKVRAKEDAEHVLAAAQRDVRTAHEELEECARAQKDSADRLRYARVEMVSCAIGGASGEKVRWRRDYISRLGDEYRSASDATRAQESTVGEAEERLAAAREALASRSRDVEVLEKHKAKLQRRFNAEAARKEAVDHEEMANAVYVQARRTI